MKILAKSAVTLVEVMVVVIIIGILVSISVPLFPKAIESTKAKYAVASLQQIRTGERIYRLDTGYFYPHHIGHPAVESDEAQINQDLRIYLDVRERDWKYEVDTSATDDFSATAIRSSGSATYLDKTITMDEDGQLGGTWPLPLPGQ